MFDADRLSRVLERVPGIAGQACTVTELDGGLTNTNVKVAVDSGYAVVVRLSSPDGDVLEIDRDAEHTNSTRAAETGVAPAVVAYVPDERALVIDFVEGRTLTPADLTDPHTLARVAAACRALHAGQPFVAGWDMFAVQRRYLALVKERGFRLPARYEEFMTSVSDVERAVAVQAGPLVPCNNDLLAANLLDDGQRIWVIDYEYAGNNDPCFELGDIYAESNLSLDDLAQLVQGYHGRHLRHAVARARLFGLLSNYGWTLWASIQDATSDIDFDFWTWGMDKYDRAVAEFDDPAFGRLLDEAARPD